MTDPLAIWRATYPEAAAALSALTLSMSAPEPTARADASEAAATSLMRLAAASAGWALWRNNNGALKDAKGRLIRYGLGHESKRTIERLKSSDWIGWRTVRIEPHHVGSDLAQFVTVETKHAGWHLTPGDDRGQAQLRWIELVNAAGGHGFFSTGGIYV